MSPLRINGKLDSWDLTRLHLEYRNLQQRQSLFEIRYVNSLSNVFFEKQACPRLDLSPKKHRVTSTEDMTAQ